MGYNEILDNMEFSFSRLHQFEECPYAFYLKKIEGEELDEGNYYSDIGGYVHEINEMIFKGELSIDDAADYFMEHYEENVSYPARQSTVEKKYCQALEYFAEFDLEKLQDYEVLGVEMEVHFKIGKYSMIGYIDLLLRHKETGEILLVDHKSAGRFFGKNGQPLKSQADNLAAYSKQMYLYSKAVYDLYGKYPDKIIWNHFFDKNISVIEFNQEDYEAALNWALETIEKIYQEEEFPAKKSYMLCHVLCGFRNSCLYASEEDEEE